MSTRAHSALRGSIYGTAPRRPLLTGDYYVQRSFPSSYDTRSEEYSIGDSVLRATVHSDAVLDDTYDTSAKSRSRDRRLLSDVTNAIPPSVFEPVKPSRLRTRLKPLSRRSRNLVESKAMYNPPPSLSTSTLTANPRPYQSLPSSLLKYSSRAKVTSLPTGVRRFVGPNLRRPLYENDYEADDVLMASAPPAPRLLGGYVSPRIASKYYLPEMRDDQSSFSYLYPEQSRRLLGGYVSPKMTSANPYIGMSPLSLIPYKRSGMLSQTDMNGSYFPSKISHPSTSHSYSLPYSGKQSHTSFPRESSSVLPYSDSDDSDPYQYHKSKRRVLGSKRHVSNYYKRLANKRAAKQGKSKYWPYYDVESIASSDVSDVLSDTESTSDYQTTYTTGGKTYSIDDEDVDYVPFVPKHNHQEGLLELSAYEDESPKYESMNVLPYIPSSLRQSVPNYDNTHDMHFNQLLSDSTARARSALSNLLRTYDDASLLMRVEGDAVTQHHDGKVGFRYYHPPVSVKGTGIDRRHLTLTPLVKEQNDFLGDYVSKIRSLQQDVRSNLLKEKRNVDVSPYSYDQKLRFLPVRIGTVKHVVPVTSFRKRLAGGLRHRLDVFHLPLVEKVLPETSQQLVLSSRELNQGGDAKLSPLKLSVLDKIRIKVSSESHSSPGSAVASRRAKSHPLTAPRPVVVSKSRLVDSKVAAISPPAFKLDHLTYWPYDNKRFIVVSKALTYNVPLRVIYTGADKWDSDVYLPTYLGWPTRSAYPYYYTTSTVPRRFRAVSTVNPSWASYTIARSRYLARSPLKTVRHPFIYRKIRKRAKAALVASRVEVEPPRRRRKPHSQYAANKLRETRRPGDQESYIPVSVNTAVLHASRPPFPLPSDRKAIRDVDGFTKPRNILSWQYRLESRVNPTEVMYKPGVYSRMREQVRDAHDKLDRHRQLLDRYMSETGDVNLNRHLKAVDSDDRIGGSRGRSSSAPPAPTQPAMSDLRRRLRKTICKSKRDPNYYRE